MAEASKNTPSLKTSPEYVKDIMKVLEVGRSVGLNPKKRIESYVFMPLSEASMVFLI